MNAIFDGVTQQTLGNCSPGILYYPSNQNSYQQYPGSYNGFPNWSQQSSNTNTQSPALNFFNNNISNGYYNPISYQPQNQWQNSYNGFYPSQQGGGCMNNIGQGTAQIGQMLPYYNPYDVANWAVQVFAYAYFQGMMYSQPQQVSIYQNNTTWLYFP